MAPLFPGGAHLPRSVSGGAWAIIVPVLVLGILFAAVLRSPRAPEAPASLKSITVFGPTFEHLPVVPGGHYELWAEHPDGGKHRLAAFQALSGGSLLTLEGEPAQTFPIDELPPAGSVLLLTVERGSELAPGPSDRVLLRGALGTTEVTFQLAVSPHLNLEGKHVAMLLAPTDPSAPDTSGVWFAQPTETKGKPAPGLALPVLSGGWAYGGFVTTAAGTVLPTGLFVDPSRPDDGTPFSGTRKGLSLPGEDFVKHVPEGVTFPLNLADGRSTLTVSLLPDFATEATEPFLSLLGTRIAYQQKPNVAFSLEAEDEDLESFPAGSGSFEVRSP